MDVRSCTAILLIRWTLAQLVPLCARLLHGVVAISIQSIASPRRFLFVCCAS